MVLTLAWTSSRRNLGVSWQTMEIAHGRWFRDETRESEKEGSLAREGMKGENHKGGKGRKRRALRYSGAQGFRNHENHRKKAIEGCSGHSGLQLLKRQSPSSSSGGGWLLQGKEGLSFWGSVEMWHFHQWTLVQWESTNGKHLGTLFALWVVTSLLTTIPSLWVKCAFVVWLARNLHGSASLQLHDSCWEFWALKIPTNTLELLLHLHLYSAGDNICYCLINHLAD